MAASAFFAALHHLLFFIIAAVLAAELVLVAEPVTVKSAKRLALLDAHYGAAAVGILVVGFLRAIYFEKGWDFYAHNPFFHAKIGAFLLVGLLSIYPSIQFVKWRRSAVAHEKPPDAPRRDKVRLLILVELIGLGVVFVCAALMTRSNL
jgi:putative membrane protein